MSRRGEGRLVGFTCAYTPPALIDAAGFVPYRILPMSGAEERAGVLLHDNLCPHVKRVLDRGLAGDVPPLAGAVFMDSCDAMRRLADAWVVARPEERTHLVDLPPTRDEGAVARLATGLGRLAEALEAWGGQAVTEERLGASLARYRELEDGLLDELAKGADPAEVLEAKPFPKLHKTKWVREALELIDSRDGTAFGAALGWFGDTILKLVDGREPRPPGRPWAAAFDRAEARPGEPRTSREVFNDWIADELWSLGWNDERTLEMARVELATRLAIAQDICERLERLGLRADRSAAEAVTIVELVGESDFWKEIVERM